jgi:putative flavoprotein involved in K+ transport
MSRRLAERGVDHVVLERGQVANSWRTQRWDSFTLLTPNWQNRLPGQNYDGDDPDGFMTAGELVSYIERYAVAGDTPVEQQTTVTAVRPEGNGYEVVTDRGTWRCRCVVLAGGACSRPSIPAWSEAAPDGVTQIDPLRYRAPDQLPDGGVLVVGAAATGVQLAEEIHRSGRPVTLSVGEHVRMPRTYRGLDIQHWMESIGRLDERYDEVEDVTKARKVASPQLIGTEERRTLDLNTLSAQGVALRGRLGGLRDGVAMFSGGLRNHCALADQKLARLLDDIDQWVSDHDLDTQVGPVERSEPTRVERGTPLTVDLRRGEIGSIVWATGFHPDFSWVELPVFGTRGELLHDGGVVEAPGMYVLGASFLRRRRSSFLHGADADTADLADHLVGHLASTR